MLRQATTILTFGASRTIASTTKGAVARRCLSHSRPSCERSRTSTTWQRAPRIAHDPSVATSHRATGRSNCCPGACRCGGLCRHHPMHPRADLGPGATAHEEEVVAGGVPQPIREHILRPKTDTELRLAREAVDWSILSAFATTVDQAAAECLHGKLVPYRHLCPVRRHVRVEATDPRLTAGRHRTAGDVVEDREEEPIHLDRVAGFRLYEAEEQIRAGAHGDVDLAVRRVPAVHPGELGLVEAVGYDLQVHGHRARPADVRVAELLRVPRVGPHAAQVVVLDVRREPHLVLLQVKPPEVRARGLFLRRLLLLLFRHRCCRCCRRLRDHAFRGGRRTRSWCEVLVAARSTAASAIANLFTRTATSKARSSGWAWKRLRSIDSWATLVATTTCVASRAAYALADSTHLGLATIAGGRDGVGVAPGAAGRRAIGDLRALQTDVKSRACGRARKRRSAVNAWAALISITTNPTARATHSVAHHARVLHWARALRLDLWHHGGEQKRRPQLVPEPPLGTTAASPGGLGGQHDVNL
mmetsp:Transcript_66967/g.217939  ORF Transcript_66967/g.217939 Transcript_66967/m.217939 type:complete len:531 (-) Transcript_66967:730-2322(-)